MTDLHFEIKQQNMSLKSGCNTLVNKTNNYIHLYFSFETSDWDNREKFCIIQDSHNNHYLYHIDDSETPVILGSQALMGNQIMVGCYGVKNIDGEHQSRVTTDVYRLGMKESNYSAEIIPHEEEQKDVISDLYSKISEINEILPLKSNVGHTHIMNDISDFPTLSTVATTGSYNDLLNKPTIPSKISDLDNDSDFIEKSSTNGLIKNDGTIDTVTKLTASDIVNDLTTGGTTKVLSAEQGKALNDLIGDAITYINGTGS